MIRSRTGTVKLNNFRPVLKEKTFEASITNYCCLFCQKSIMIANIHEAKCSCGSQWFEKKKGKKVKVCEAV